MDLLTPLLLQALLPLALKKPTSTGKGEMEQRLKPAEARQPAEKPE